MKNSKQPTAQSNNPECQPTLAGAPCSSWYPLFEHMRKEHGLALLEDELRNIAFKADESRLTPPASEVWIACSAALPPPDTDVETKIDDGKGVRNVCALRHHSNLWWFKDMSMYAYYSPTHWRPLQPNV